MLNLHIYLPDELSPQDRRTLHDAGFNMNLDVVLIVYTTKLSTSPEFPGWDGSGFFNPSWRCEYKGHWYVYFHETNPVECERCAGTGIHARFMINS